MEQGQLLPHDDAGVSLPGDASRVHVSVLDAALVLIFVCKFAHSLPPYAWISKPVASGGGKGIEVESDYREVLQKSDRKLVVQPYLPNPLLIDGTKWDLRTYVLLTSVRPVRAYVHARGLVRFATKSSFLTNTAINKGGAGASLSEVTWPFSRLAAFLGADAYGALFSRVAAAIGATLAASEGAFARTYDEVVRPGFGCEGCYHLLGVDLIVDDRMVPRVIEVNGEPSMAREGVEGSHYDATKTKMRGDAVGMALSAADRPLVDRLVAELEKMTGPSGSILGARPSYARGTSSTWRGGALAGRVCVCVPRQGRG